MKSLRDYTLAGLLLFLSLKLVNAQDWEFESGVDYSDPENQIIDAIQVSTSGPEVFTALSVSVPAVSLTSGVADQIFPEITALANSLGNDPAKITEFVFNSITYEHYYGSKRGARLTLLEGAGNDYDQASLLVALLRAAGYPAGYATEWNIVNYDSFNSLEPTGFSWLNLPEEALPGVPLGPVAEAERIAWDWTVEHYKETLVLQDFCRPKRALSATRLTHATA
ncbi:MAG: transglutaminase-like domain-containing protein [Verrucomicrobiota bacterium]